MPCGGKCTFNWFLGHPKPQDTRGHLHTCWLVLLHQKPAGSMEAKLPVGIRAVIKIGHHSGSHGRVCWGEKRHWAQVYSTGRHACQRPHRSGGAQPWWLRFLVPTGKPSIGLTHFLPETPALGALQQGFVYLFTSAENKTTSQKESAWVSDTRAILLFKSYYPKAT